MYTKHEIRLVAATDGTNYKSKVFEHDDKPTHETARTDVAAVISGTVTIANSASFTINLADHDISAIRMIYIETSGQVAVSLLDNSAATNELTTFVVGGSSATTGGEFFCECAGFTIASGDTMVFANSSGSAVTVTYWLGGPAA